METDGHERKEIDLTEVEPVDLSALDPLADSRRFDTAVAAIVGRARPELTRRLGRAVGVGPTLRRWGRVAWPAAAAVALASLAVLRTEAPALAATVEPTIAEEMALAVGVPEALAPWVDEVDSPALGEILVGWEEGSR